MNKLSRHQKRLKAIRKDNRERTKITEEAAQICMDVLGIVPVYVLLEQYGWKRKRLTRFIQRYQKVMNDVNTHKIGVEALSDEIYQQTKIKYDDGDWYLDK